MRERKTTSGVMGAALAAGGAVLLALALLWQISFVMRGAWPVTTLIFAGAITLILLGPVIGAGLFLRGRAAGEAGEADLFAARRTVMDADVTLRREVVRELEQALAALDRAQTALSGAAAQDVVRARRLLTDARDDLSRPGYSAGALLEGSAGLGEAQLASVRRYDDLLSAQAHRLGELARRVSSEPDSATALTDAAQLFASHVNERETLLGRGRLAAPLSPQELLQAGATPRRRVDDPVALSLEDAVSYEGEDYVVRGVLDYFGGGRRWRAYQLHDGRNERWLEVRADGTQLTWLMRQTGAVPPSGDQVSLDGVTYRQSERGAASVSIESAAGRQDGVLVDYRRFSAESGALTLEDWPDGERALVGRTVQREDLDLWTKPAS
ncbi:MAG TPA: DUF4178 domain-containing protein, partial [Chloroflexota bacterium]|nr:DUF4178 domain-containing protein [Chloroflexota bacterium]